MKPRPTQFDTRENTASPRQHASRLTVDIGSNPLSIVEQRFGARISAPDHDSSIVSVEDQSHAAPKHAATVKESKPSSQLLTVREVAQLLRVPVSWVYGRMRKRSRDRLPGYRLGKYWRFREDEILAWVQRQRGGEYVA